MQKEFTSLGVGKSTKERVDEIKRKLNCESYDEFLNRIMDIIENLVKAMETIEQQYKKQKGEKDGVHMS